MLTLWPMAHQQKISINYNYHWTTGTWAGLPTVTEWVVWSVYRSVWLPQSWALQKQLKWSRCHLGCGIRWPEGTMYWMVVQLSHGNGQFQGKKTSTHCKVLGPSAVSHAKMQLVILVGMGTENHVLDGVQILHRKEQFRGKGDHQNLAIFVFAE